MDVSCGYGNPKNTGVQWRSGLYTEVVWSEDEQKWNAGRWHRSRPKVAGCLVSRALIPELGLWGLVA